MMDVRANRSAQKWTRAEQAGRIFWTLIQPVFRFSPRPFWGWRRMVLRLFGAKVGREVHVYPTVRIAIPWNLDLGDQCAVGDRAILYSLGKIRLCERVTISQGAHICAGTHDLGDPARRLLKPPISIGADAWICADAFVGPGVTIGAHAVVGARAVVMKDVEGRLVVVGNPAKPIKRIAE